MNRPEYNDNPLPYDEEIYSRLRAHGALQQIIMELMAQFCLKELMTCYPSIFLTYLFEIL